MGYPNEDCGCGCKPKSCEKFSVEIIKLEATPLEVINNIYTFKVIILNGTAPYDITWVTNSDAYLVQGNSKQEIIKLKLNPVLTGLDKNDFFLKVIVIDKNNCIAKDVLVMKNYTETVIPCPCCKMKVKIDLIGYDSVAQAYVYTTTVSDANINNLTYDWSFASEALQYEIVQGSTSSTLQVRINPNNLDDTMFENFMVRVKVTDSDACFAMDYFHQSTTYWNRIHNNWDYFYNRH